MKRIIIAVVEKVIGLIALLGTLAGLAVGFITYASLKNAGTPEEQALIIGILQAVSIVLGLWMLLYFIYLLREHA
ncbi:MAG: hypothetical protein GXO03_06450 [Aquificae bacterium]|nr:hypothetical protein [Aquificota bacterium]